MARQIGGEDGTELYFVQFHRAAPDGSEFEWIEGPYTKKGTAKQRISFWKNYLARREPAWEVTGDVVKPVIVGWEIVE